MSFFASIVGYRHINIHIYVFIDLAAKLAGLWCTLDIKNITTSNINDVL